MSHVINSRALTGEKPCINKAIHALLMQGHATFNMLVQGPQNCCRHEMCSARPKNEDSPWKLHSRDISEKAKQNRARNNAKCTKCFQFLCNNSDRTLFFQCINIRQVPWEVLKPRLSGSVFNTSHGTWRMLMHEKTCLIPIMKMKINSEIPEKSRNYGKQPPQGAEHGFYYVK